MTEKTPASIRPTPQVLASFIDHTLLKPDASRAEILRLCEEARRFNFKTVCVNGRWIETVAKALEGSPCLPIACVGFPLGAGLSESKAAETKACIAHGAREIDMVLDIGSLKSGEWETVKADVAAVTRAAGSVPVKVILEICLLTEEEIARACRLCEEAGAAFVKTSTGFSKAGATLEAVRLMRASVSPKVEVKASGGVRDLKTFLAMVEAGATRIGTSSGIAILEEAAKGGA